MFGKTTNIYVLFRGILIASSKFLQRQKVTTSHTILCLGSIVYSFSCFMFFLILLFLMFGLVCIFIFLFHVYIFILIYSMFPHVCILLYYYFYAS